MTSVHIWKKVQVIKTNQEWKVDVVEDTLDYRTRTQIIMESV